MKLIACGLCFDIRALIGFQDDPVSCNCGNVSGWWRNPVTGTASVHAKNRDKAKIMGISNSYLKRAFTAYDFSDAKWRELHDEATDCKGYLFDKSHRACPIVIVGIGNSTDVIWAENRPPEKEAQ
jgi:hypothetical protein